MSDQAPTSGKSRLASRLAPLLDRLDTFLKEFEWTWTKAVLFCLFMAFLMIITAVVLPSFWLYFAEQRLGWGGPSGGGAWSLEIRDAIAMGLTTGPIVTYFAVATILQNRRRKLRGSGGDVRPTGGYR